MRIASEPRRSGFTLIELVVAVTIVGILTVIAVPAYSIYALRTNRAVAKAALVSLAAQQETFFVDRKVYTLTLSDLNFNAYLSRDGSTSATQSSNTIYTLSIGALSTSCPAPTAVAPLYSYTVMAVPVGNQANDSSCATLCMTSSGIRLASAGTAANCWSR